jgi:hypothetical protein
MGPLWLPWTPSASHGPAVMPGSFPSTMKKVMSVGPFASGDRVWST